MKRSTCRYYICIWRYLLLKNIIEDFTLRAEYIPLLYSDVLKVRNSLLVQSPSMVLVSWEMFIFSESDSGAFSTIPPSDDVLLLWWLFLKLHVSRIFHIHINTKLEPFPRQLLNQGQLDPKARAETDSAACSCSLILLYTSSAGRIPEMSLWLRWCGKPFLILWILHIIFHSWDYCHNFVHILEWCSSV